MFSYDEDGKNILNLTQSQTIWLIVSLSLIVIAVVLGIVLYKTKKHLFKNYLKYSTLVALIYSAVVIVYNVVTDYIEDSEDYQQYQLWLTVTVFAIIAVIVILTVVRKQHNKFNAYAIAMAAVCISISFALSYIRLFRLPQGGSITMASLTLLGLYSYMFGIRRGVLVGLVYGILQSLQDPWVVHPLQYILEYPIAFAMIGLVGIFKGRLKSNQVELAVGFALAIALRYLCHFFAGAIFFGSYGEEFGIFNAWAWGAIYNLFVPIDGLLACIVAGRLLASRQISQLLLSRQQTVDNISG